LGGLTLIQPRLFMQASSTLPSAEQAAMSRRNSAAV
jgi:hypothetical protein